MKKFLLLKLFARIISVFILTFRNMRGVIQYIVRCIFRFIGQAIFLPIKFITYLKNIIFDYYRSRKRVTKRKIKDKDKDVELAGWKKIISKVCLKIKSLETKTYWIPKKIYNKSYWFARSNYEKMYWRWRHKKNKIIQNMCKNDYFDIFVIFLSSYLNREELTLMLYDIDGVEHFCKKKYSKNKIRVVEEQKLRKVCIPEFYEKSTKEILEFQSDKIYVAELEAVDIVGGSDVILAQDTFLSDALFKDKKHRLDLRYGAIRKVLKNSVLIEGVPFRDKIPKVISLVGAASFNYYHLMVEILSRLTFVDKFEEYWNLPILVDQVVLDIPQFAEALNYFNCKNHEILVVEKNCKYQIENLVLPSHTVWMPINLKNRDDIRPKDFLIAESVLHNIRNLVPLYEEKKPWRKIFISRKNTKAMRLQNEEKIRDIFEQHGFEIIYTEEMSFEEQVECFGQASCVVASSGAALTNIIFCQPGTRIGCIIPSYHRFYMYSTIAYYLQLNPIFLDAEIVEKTPYAAADVFVANEEYAKRYVEDIG